MIYLQTDYTFDSAHFLPDPYAGKCSRMHGHTYHLRVKWKVPQDLDEVGMALDFGYIKRLINEYLEQYDHHILNDVMTATPTAEVMVKQIAEELTNYMSNLDLLIRPQVVTLWETESCAAVWERD